ITWGGICHITDWADGDSILLDNWPGEPAFGRDGKDVVIALGLSAIVVENWADEKALRKATTRAPGP
ncbi:MAG: hypothetical protein OEY05_14755, partial [Paracoccaceae bacterium]|nr:hypothetical protein [Paracoccaceae bacterium]